MFGSLPLDEINRRANAVAAYVCSQPGATPALPVAGAVRAMTGETDKAQDVLDAVWETLPPAFRGEQA